MASQIEIAELNIRFVGDTDALQKGTTKAEAVVTASFRKVEKSADGVEKSFDKVDKSGKKLDTGAVNLAARMQILTQAYDAFRGVANKGLALAQLGAQSQRVEYRFEKFAATIGDSSELLAAFQKGAGGTVDKMTAMNTAALLVQQGLVTNNDEMEKTVELATRLGDQTQSATSRLEFFSQLLKNQSIRLLDNFGISSGVVRRRIKELQDATAGLTREEAFRIAVFEEGQKALDILGERVDDNAAKFERAQAKWQDARVEMGEKLAPVLASVANLVSGLNSTTLILTTTLAGALGMAVKFGGGLSGLVSKLGMTGAQFGLVTASVGTLIAAYEVYRRTQKIVREGQENINKALEGWEVEAKDAKEAGESLSDMAITLSDRVNKANDALHKNGHILEDIATSLVRTTQEEKIMSGAADEARKALIKQADSVEEANAAIELYNARLDNAKAALDEVTDAEYESYQSLDHVTSSAFATEAGLAELEDRYGLLTDEILENRQAIKDAVQAAKDADTSYRSLGDALDYAALRDKRMREQQQKSYEQGQLLIEMERKRKKANEERAEAALAFAEKEKKAREEELEAILKAGEEIQEALNKEVEARERALEIQMRRAEALKDASDERIARSAIDELARAQEAGLISFEDYTKAVVEIQDTFGLADDRSRALTLGLGMMVEGLSSGAIAAENMDTFLQQMIADAEDGVIAFENLVEQVGAFGTAVDLMGPPITRTHLVGPEGAGGDPRGAWSAGPRMEEGGRMAGDPRGGGGRGEAVAMGGVVIYGGLHLEGIEDAEDFFRQLMALGA